MTLETEQVSANWNWVKLQLPMVLSFCNLPIATKTQLNKTAFMTDNANGSLWLEMAQRKIMAGSAKCAKRLARRLTAAASGSTLIISVMRFSCSSPKRRHSMSWHHKTWFYLFSMQQDKQMSSVTSQHSLVFGDT